MWDRGRVAGCRWVTPFFGDIVRPCARHTGAGARYLSVLFEDFVKRWVPDGGASHLLPLSILLCCFTPSKSTACPSYLTMPSVKCSNTAASRSAPSVLIICTPETTLDRTLRGGFAVTTRLTGIESGLRRRKSEAAKSHTFLVRGRTDCCTI